MLNNISEFCFVLFCFHPDKVFTLVLVKLKIEVWNTDIEDILSHIKSLGMKSRFQTCDWTFKNNFGHLCFGNCTEHFAVKIQAFREVSMEV